MPVHTLSPTTDGNTLDLAPHDTAAHTSICPRDGSQLSHTVPTSNGLNRNPPATKLLAVVMVAAW